MKRRIFPKMRFVLNLFYIDLAREFGFRDNLRGVRQSVTRKDPNILLNNLLQPVFI